MSNVPYNLAVIDYDQLSSVAPDLEAGQAYFYSRNGVPCYQNGNGVEVVLSAGGSGNDPLAIHRDNSQPPTANIGFGNFRIFELADPLNPQDAATKAYVDAHSGGGGLSNYGTVYSFNSAIDVPIAFAANFVQLPSGLTTGIVNNMTFVPSNGLQMTVAGAYMIAYSLTIQSGTANEVLIAGVMVNGVALPSMNGGCESSMPNQPKCVSATGVVSLAIGDIVSVCLQNATAAHDILVSQCTLTVLGLGA